MILAVSLFMNIILGIICRVLVLAWEEESRMLQEECDRWYNKYVKMVEENDERGQE